VTSREVNLRSNGVSGGMVAPNRTEIVDFTGDF
jgi:hypothetical protein